MKFLLNKFNFLITLLLFFPKYSYLLARPAYKYGNKSFEPETLKVTFYELGLTNSDFSKKFSVFDNSNGTVLDIADANQIQSLVNNVKAEEGEYTHIYALLSNKYKIKGYGNGCYTKSVKVKKTNNSSEFTNIYYEDGSIYENTFEIDGYLAATDDQSQYGEATIIEQAFRVSNDGIYDFRHQHYGPAVPSTKVSVDANVIDVENMHVFLTNSNAPYKTYPAPIEDAIRFINIPVSQFTYLKEDAPATSTRNRTLYYGKLPNTITIEADSSGIVELTFDFIYGLSFDNQCKSFKFNNNKFNMSIIKN